MPTAEVRSIFYAAFMQKLAAEGFSVNQITKVANPSYPTEEELERFRAFRKSDGRSKNMMIPQDIADIGRRKREMPYKIAVTKVNLPESDYTILEDGKMFLRYDHMLEVRFKKYLYEIKKGEFVKAKFPVSQISYLHPEGDAFEIFSDGNNANPGMLTNQGAFTTDKIEKLLPLDYTLGD